MKKKKYIIPVMLTVETELGHLLKGTNKVTGDDGDGQIVTDDDEMEEGDGEDAAIKEIEIDFVWGNLWYE